MSSLKRTLSMHSALASTPAADVGHVEQLEQPLDGAVLAERAVQRREHGVGARAARGRGAAPAPRPRASRCRRARAARRAPRGRPGPGPRAPRRPRPARRRAPTSARRRGRRSSWRPGAGRAARGRGRGGLGRVRGRDVLADRDRHRRALLRLAARRVLRERPCRRPRASRPSWSSGRPRSRPWTARRIASAELSPVTSVTSTCAGSLATVSDTVEPSSTFAAPRRGSAPAPCRRACRCSPGRCA